MLTRNQRYAEQIFEQVSRLSEAEHEKYSSMARKLPILIRTAGLAQALAFVEARGSEGQKKLLQHIAEVVGRPGDLLERSRTAEFVEYMHLTRNVQAALVWYTRFVRAEGDDNE